MCVCVCVCVCMCDYNVIIKHTRNNLCVQT